MDFFSHHHHHGIVLYLHIGMQRMDSSPGLGGRPQVMPDLLPQQPTGGSPVNMSRMSSTEDPRAGMQEKQKSFMSFGFSAEAAAAASKGMHVSVKLVLANLYFSFSMVNTILFLDNIFH